MSNEIETLSAGDIQPFDPGMPILAPLSPSPDTWGTTDFDRGHDPDQITLFGQVMPAGTTEADVQKTLREVSSLFRSDFQKLGYPDHLVYPVAKWYMDYALKPPLQVRKHHDFKLPKMFMDDWLADAFCNYLHTLKGTQQQKQQFLDACLQWMAKLTQYVESQQSQQQFAVSPAQGRAPTSSGDPIDQLTDQQYAVLVKHNLKVQGQTMAALQRKYGDYTYQQVIEIAQKHLESLPARDQKYFDQYTGAWPWTHMMNTVEAIEFLYNAAIGSASLPTNGPDIAREIASIESVMKYERKKYLADPQLQARYRTLLDLKR